MAETVTLTFDTWTVELLDDGNWIAETDGLQALGLTLEDAVAALNDKLRLAAKQPDAYAEIGKRLEAERIETHRAQAKPHEGRAKGIENAIQGSLTKAVRYGSWGGDEGW